MIIRLKYIKYNSKSIAEFSLTFIQCINFRIPYQLFDQLSLRLGYFAYIYVIFRWKDVLKYCLKTDKSNKIYIFLHIYLLLVTFTDMQSSDYNFVNILFVLSIFIFYILYIIYQYLNQKFEVGKKIDLILNLLMLNLLYCIFVKLTNYDIVSYIFQSERLTSNYGVFLIGEYSPLAVCVTYFSGFLIALFGYSKKNSIKYITYSLIFLIASILTNEKIIFIFILVSIIGLDRNLLKSIIHVLNKQIDIRYLIIIILIFFIYIYNIGINDSRLFYIKSYAINMDRIDAWTSFIDRIINLGMHNPAIGYFNSVEIFGFKVNEYHNYFLKLYIEGGILSVIIFILWVQSFRRIYILCDYYRFFNVFLCSILITCFLQDGLKSYNIFMMLCLHKTIMNGEQLTTGNKQLAMNNEQ